MPTLFYAIVLGVIFFALWINLGSIVYPVVVMDMFLILFYGKIPMFAQIMMLLVNAAVWGKMFYDTFAPKKAG